MFVKQTGFVCTGCRALSAVQRYIFHQDVPAVMLSRSTKYEMQTGPTFACELALEPIFD